MTEKQIEQKAEEYVKSVIDVNAFDWKIVREICLAYIAGAEENGAVWHKVFDREPNPCEYWELPQDRLPETDDYYFVKLKNGYIKIYKLKYDSWSRKKYFYDLSGPKQSNVAEWLAYPQCEEE